MTLPDPEAGRILDRYRAVVGDDEAIRTLGLARDSRDGLQPVAPDAAAAVLVARFAERLRAEADELSGRVATLADLMPEWRRRTDALDAVIDVVHGSPGVLHAWRSYARDGSIRAIVPRGDLVDHPAVVADGAIGDLLADLRGGSRRFELILPPSARGEADARIDGLLAAGASVRVADARSWFFVAGDVVVAPQTWGDPDDGAALVLRSPTLARAFEDLFAFHWSSAEPWHSAADGPYRVLTRLARGWSDEAIAAELGLSVRSVRRRIAAEMQRLGARSRFELGLRWGRLPESAGFG